MKNIQKQKLFIKNKRAYFNYFIEDSLEAGIQLTGSEVKSIREGRADINESYARIIGEECFLLNANIPQYHNSVIIGYNPERSRKLLLHKNEIRSLIGKTSRSGWTIIPLALYEKHNMIKVQIGLGKTKKVFDKRRSLKNNDQVRRIEQELRNKM